MCYWSQSSVALKDQLASEEAGLKTVLTRHTFSSSNWDPVKLLLAPRRINHYYISDLLAGTSGIQNVFAAAPAEVYQSHRILWGRSGHIVPFLVMYGKTPWTKNLSSDESVKIYLWGGGGRVICLYSTHSSIVAKRGIGVHFSITPCQQPTSLYVYSVLIYIWVSHSSTFMVSQEK